MKGSGPMSPTQHCWYLRSACSWKVFLISSSKANGSWDQRSTLTIFSHSTQSPTFSVPWSSTFNPHVILNKKVFILYRKFMNEKLFVYKAYIFNLIYEWIKRCMCLHLVPVYWHLHNKNIFPNVSQFSASVIRP